MAATVSVHYFYDVGPSNSDAEAACKFNRVDTLTGTTPVPIPTATGTNYSYPKALALYCDSGGGSTSGSNLGIKMGSSPTTGLTMWWALYNTDTYVRSGTGTAVLTDDVVANDAEPSAVGTCFSTATFTAITTSNVTYDATGAAFVNTTKCGKYCPVAVGVGYNYAGGAGSAIALPNLVFQYDEA